MAKHLVQLDYDGREIESKTISEDVLVRGSVRVVKRIEDDDDRDEV